MTTRYAESALGRVSVVRDNRLVPLLNTGSATPITTEQPWKGLILERHVVHPGEIPDHEHPSLCLHLQLTGTCPFEWWQGGKNAIEQTRPGSLILIPPGTRDRLRWQGTSERLILSIENGALQTLASQIDAKSTAEIKGAWAASDASLSYLIAEMGRETKARWSLGTLYADLLSLSLKTALLRHYSTQQIAIPRLTGSLSLPRLRRAMEYISTNLSNDMGLSEMAGAMEMSESHFAHEFRNSTGQTPYQYLLRQRLERAKALLRATRLPVQTIASLTGFGSSNNFVRLFRQRDGVTPNAWRKHI